MFLNLGSTFPLLRHYVMGFSIRSITRLNRTECSRPNWSRFFGIGLDSNLPRFSTRVYHDNLRLMPTGTKLTTGNMIEFRKSGELVLGVVKGQHENRWIVHDEVSTPLNHLINHVNSSQVKSNLFEVRISP